MAQFVIRSMSTTDMRPGADPVPYHIYLRRPELRASAWWGGMHEAMKFDTHKEALDYVTYCGGKLLYAEVSPADADALGLPTYWENRRA